MTTTTPPTAAGATPFDPRAPEYLADPYAYFRKRRDNKDDTLFPNQFVNVRLLVDTVKDATVVPVAAIQRGQPGTFVYLVKADDTVEIRIVELGATDGDKVQIVKGLQPGDKIRRPGGPPRAASGPPIANAPESQQGAGPQQQQRRRQANGGGGAGGAAAAQPNQ